MTKMKKITASGVLIAVLSAAIIGSVGFVAFKMLSVDRDMLGSTEDRVNDNYGEQYRDNINVMLQRPDDWYQIASESFLTHSDFAGIDGSTATVPITAELARQFLNAPDGEEMNAYVSHNKTDRAYENLILGDTNRLFDLFNVNGGGIGLLGFFFLALIAMIPQALPFALYNKGLEIMKNAER